MKSQLANAPAPKAFVGLQMTPTLKAVLRQHAAQRDLTLSFLMTPDPRRVGQRAAEGVMTPRDVIGNIYSRADIGMFCVVGHHAPHKLGVWVLETGDLGRILVGQFFDGLRNGDVRFEARLADVVPCPRCTGGIEVTSVHVGAEQQPAAVVCRDCNFIEVLSEDTIPVAPDSRRH